jgi:broad specificity phosphatase PhoE
MSLLILVKHSLPEVIESVPATEWNLSERGRTRSRELAKRLIQYQPDEVFSSVESKAKQTAEIIAIELGLTMCVVDGLHEQDRKNVPYLSDEQFQSSAREFFEKPDKLVFGGETADQAHERFHQAVYSVLGRFPGRTIVLVAHGTVISLFVSRLIGISDVLLWKELGLPSFIVLDLQSNSLVTKENIV